MEELKVYLKKERERLTKYGREDSLSESGHGKLELICELENLILCEVGCSKPREEKQILTYDSNVYYIKKDVFEKMLKEDYVKVIIP